MSVNSKMTNIADAIRAKTGGTDALTLDGMVEAIAGIQAGGDTSVEDGIIDRAITEVSNNRVTSIGQYTFYSCSKLTTANFPQVTSIGSYAFENCSSLSTLNIPLATSINTNSFKSCMALTTASFPKVKDINGFAFGYCTKLTTVDFPVATTIGSQVFQGCSKLTTANFPQVASIGSSAFSFCNSLIALVLGGDTVASLKSTNVFNACYHILGTVNSTYNPDGLKDGYIYVPDALVEDYKAATNWSTYASQIKPLSEYVEVG